MKPTHTNLDLLSRLLDVASLRHRVIANNVANVNTPRFHQFEVAFEEDLARALKSGGIVSALGLEPKLLEELGLPERADGNNVDIDVEMARLNKNTLLFRTFTQVMASQLAMARSAISGQ